MVTAVRRAAQYAHRVEWDHRTAELHCFLVRFGGTQEATRAYAPAPELDRKYVQLDFDSLNAMKPAGHQHVKSDATSLAHLGKLADLLGWTRPALRKLLERARRQRAQRAKDQRNQLPIGRPRQARRQQRWFGKFRARRPSLPAGRISSISSDGVGLRLTFKRKPQGAVVAAPLTADRAAKGCQLKRKRTTTGMRLHPPSRCIYIAMDPGRANPLAAAIKRGPNCEVVYFVRTRKQWRAATGVKAHAKRVQQHRASAGAAVKAAWAALEAVGSRKCSDQGHWLQYLDVQRQHWDALYNEHVVGGRQLWYRRELMRQFSRRRSVMDRWAAQLLRYASRSHTYSTTQQHACTHVSSAAPRVKHVPQDTTSLQHLIGIAEIGTRLG